MFSQRHNTTKGMIALVILAVAFAVFRVWSKSQSRVDPPVHQINFGPGSLNLEDLDPEALEAMTKEFLEELELSNEVDGKDSVPILNHSD